MAYVKTFIVLVIFVQFCSSKVWKDVGKTLKFIGDSQQLGGQSDVFTIDARDELVEGPNTEYQLPRMAFNEARKRARRSTDGVPKTDFVSLEVNI